MDWLLPQKSILFRAVYAYALPEVKNTRAGLGHGGVQAPRDLQRSCSKAQTPALAEPGPDPKLMSPRLCSFRPAMLPSARLCRSCLPSICFGQVLPLWGQGCHAGPQPCCPGLPSWHGSRGGRHTESHWRGLPGRCSSSSAGRETSAMRGRISGGGPQWWAVSSPQIPRQNQFYSLNSVL